MSRPSSFALIAFATLAVAIFTACSNPYRKMYSPQRNHFKPVKDAPPAESVLPPAPEAGGAAMPGPSAPPVEAPPPDIPGL
jgi:hypothetical protein